MVKLRPIDKVIEKWKTRSSQAAPEYQFGIQNPLNDWATNTAAAKDAWRQGVTDAAGRGAFEKGVKAAGTEFWQRRSLELGVGRYADGVSKSADVYQARFAPYYEELAKLTLPPRGPRGDPRNLERVRAVMETLRRKKTGGVMTGGK